jgi:hypothetical protein
MLKTKQKFFAMLIVVLLIVPITAFSMPTAKATTIGEIGCTSPDTEGYPDLKPLPSGVTPDYEIDTVAYLSFRPDPIGVGQSLLVNVWLSPGTYHAFPMTGLVVDIVKPDGSTMTVGPFGTYVGDSTAWFEMIPDQVGTWQLKFTFPGTYIPTGQYWDAPGSETGGFMASGKYYNLGASILYKPSETEWQNLTVQEDIVSSWPYRPMTTDYWTRPVNPMWRDWGMSIGDYPFNTVYYYANGRVLYPSNYKFTAYVTAPNSAHVVWKREALPGGSTAGMIGGYTWDYSATSNAGTPSIIYDGRCYQSVTKIFEDGTQSMVLQCYNLRTGQVYWERPVSTTTTMGMFGPSTTAIAPQYIEYMAPGTTYAVGSTSIARETFADQGWNINFIGIYGDRLYRFDPSTGEIRGNYSISPISGGTYYMPGYALSVQNLGNSVPADQRYRLINWTTFGSASDFADRITGNISWPRSSLGVVDYEACLAASCSWASPPGPQWCIGVSITMTDLRTGQNLWTYQTNDTLSENAQSPSSFVLDHGKLAYGGHGRHWVCFDGRTGAKVWTSEQTAYPWGAWFPYNTASFDINETCGAIITSTYEGVYAINWADGKILWRYTDTNAVPFEGPYGATSFFTGVISADGKIYAYNGEHTTSLPRDRAWSTYCIDGTTGELIWKIYNPMTPGAVADGYLTAANPYDGYMYVFGKGMSTTTVTASPKTPAQGAQVLIEGTVMDMSPAQPNTPCVSQDSMGLQMEIIHMQMPQAGLWGNETISGVPVILTAIGSDGSVIDIGSTTTNGYYGTFSYAWTPLKEDVYTIMASFAGDDSYGSSSAATGLSVGPAPTEAPTATTQAQTDYMPTLTGILAGVVVAIIISVIALAVVLRKHA